MLTTLQKANWFSGMARSDVEVQKKLVVTFADAMLRQNATRGVEKREPLVYKDALVEAKKVCRAHGINHACLFFGGAYVGGKNSQEIRNKIMNLVSGVKDQRVWADPRGAGASSSGTTRPAGLHGEWWQWRRPRGSPGTWRSPRRTRRPHLLGREPHEEEP